jgi:hypothetical protein
VGNLVLLNAGRETLEITFRHEAVHLIQLSTLEGIIGRPVERAARRRIPVLRGVPPVVQLGVVTPFLIVGDDRIHGGDGFVRRLMEAEAEWLVNHVRY